MSGIRTGPATKPATGAINISLSEGEEKGNSQTYGLEKKPKSTLAKIMIK